MSLKRLYIFTGKGGVGKTTLSLSFTKHLQDQGKKAKVAYFKTSKLDEQTKQYQEVTEKAKKLGIEAIGLDLFESAQAYIAKKLGSTTVAYWVVKTPFFKSLINMIPGFNYLVYMGQILQYLVDDPDLILILDSPSSGHALTMFEATKNFSQIFQKGLLYEDTKLMVDMLSQQDFVQINIITLPTLLALQEAEDLQQSLKQIENFDIRVICNYGLESYQALQLPQCLRQKIANEQTATAESPLEISSKIPFCLADQPELLGQQLLPFMQSLV